MTKTLTHNTDIKIAAWDDTVSAQVFTVAGYAAENGKNPAEYVARAESNGHDLVGCIYIGGALVGDRVLAQKMLDTDRRRHHAAVLIEDGEIVSIDGTLHKVRVIPGNAEIGRAHV